MGALPSQGPLLPPNIAGVFQKRFTAFELGGGRVRGAAGKLLTTKGLFGVMRVARAIFIFKN